jgi:hypothetical protein
MKSHLLILISAVFLIPFLGCKKKSFDPTGKSQADFIGTWTGSISTFKNNKVIKETGTLVIYNDLGNNLLTGILFMKETSVFHEFQFVNGTMYFKVENSDSASPFCQNWNLGGYAVFSETSKMDINISGNECGDIGKEFVSWTGSVVPASVSDDSVQYYNFATAGNSSTYRVTLKNGDSCQVQKQVSQASANYLFSGATSQTCGWAGQTKTFSWKVSPAVFSFVNDSTLGFKSFTFPINARPGVVYSTIVNHDTTTVTLLDTNLVMTTPAGSFNCMYFKYTEPVNSGILKVNRTAYLWLNNRFGVIRQEVVNPVDSTDVQLQVLLSKNF